MKHDVSDFPDVYVPLDQAQRHPSVVTGQDEKLGTKDVSSSDYKEVEAGKKSKVNYGATTLEGLRAEIESGMLSISPKFW